MFLAVNDQGMPGIVAALEPNDNVRPLRKEIDYFALAFVTPLRADDHHICHKSLFLSNRSICPKRIQAQRYPGVFT